MLNFDSDKEVPMFGFGAHIGHGKTSHCFAMNGNIFRPEAVNLDGMMNNYQQSLSRVSLSGPTHFSPILKYVNEMVWFNVEQSCHRYFTLLILTDGVIHDFEQTKDEIVQSSYLPISIIIVGVGNADFSEMDELDADEGRLFSEYYQKFQERDNL